MRSNITRLTAITLCVACFVVLGCGDDGAGPISHRPQITSLTAVPATVEPSGWCAVTCAAQDADGDSLSYGWGAEAGQITGSGAAVTWTAPNQGGVYSVWVTVNDGTGKTASDTVGVQVQGGTLLVKTDTGVMAVTLEGTTHLFYEASGQVEVLGTRIFIGPGTTIKELDHNGTVISTITKPAGFPYGTTFMVLPDAGFAFIDNEVDSIYFMDADGVFLAANSIVHPSPGSNQGTKGMTVGNNLYVVDSSPDWVYKYDLDTYEGIVFEEFPDQNFNTYDIDYSDGRFYVVGSTSVHSFTEGGVADTLCILPASNVVSIAVVGSYAYTITNFTGDLHRVNVYTGEYELLTGGLDYPSDIEYIPVDLPGTR